ncbi:hypothetical protein MIND_00125200 [Mycena indigotica]|uniref:Transmembrane protein n=1 Tax=Mycena indigotica TaxID=2126181 RepID=A0A8H6TG12_9AGAR|nr:uncharacterized protein MIND_00125200 [Mycena indigotica]KAF7316072.1 hypothetical protein MIND_00125200 [Mycena indigotica]
MLPSFFPIPWLGMNIIVDDQDPSIIYKPAWSTTGSDGNPRGDPQEFNRTTSHGVRSGSTASFTFTGTQITIFGTLFGSDTAFLQFTINGTQQPAAYPESADPPFHRAVWDSGPLPHGQHALVMEDTTPATSNFFFDYMIYKTDVRGPSQTGFVDDNESAVSFSSRWSSENTFEFMQHMSRWTEVAGQSVTVQYNFLEGDQLSLYGAVALTDPATLALNAPLSASVSIDDGPPVDLPPQNAPAAQQIQYNQKLYTSPALAAGSHTFNFTYHSGTSLWVDYYLVEQGSDNGDGGSSSSFNDLPLPVQTSAAMNLSGNPTPTQSSTSFPSISTQPQSPPNHRSNSAAVAGGVIASFLLLSMFAAILWLRRRNIQRNNRRRAVPLDVEAATVAPQFPLSKSALAARRGPVAQMEELETNDAGPQLMVSAARLSTDELVQILRSRNVAITGEEQPPGYPPTERGTRGT